MLTTSNKISLDSNSDKIDKKSYQPAYLQLANILKEKIASGLFRPGEQLPSESELRTQYKISQMTIRRAISILQEQGVVDTSQGKGSFVKAMKIDMFSFQLSALQQLFADKKTEIKLLKVDLVFPDSRTKEILSVADGDRVVFLLRLICSDDTPVLIHKESLLYDPTRPLVESEMEVTSLSGLFSGNGHTEFKKGEMSLSTAVVVHEDSELLEIAENSDVFKIEHLFYDFSDKAVSFGVFLCRSDLIKFNTRVGLW